jgi:hypothetical protein
MRSESEELILPRSDEHTNWEIETPSQSPLQIDIPSEPTYPIKKGRCGTMTHDYKRNGTTTLFAALEVLQGRVIGQCHERRRHQAFLQFRRRLDQEFPGKTPLHLVMDNYGTHKHAKVREWLKRHPRHVLPFCAYQFRVGLMRAYPHGQKTLSLQIRAGMPKRG